MKRLPIRFEEEVLSKHGISWVDSGNIPGFYSASPYEIAAIALEAMVCVYLTTEEGHHQVYTNKDLPVQHKDLPVQHKDFCECIFKAIEESYK